MEWLGEQLMMYIGAGGLLAPILFISFHLLRPIFFLPVMFICISGGLIFGTFAGTLYSIIGITLSSILFYVFIRKMPKTFNRLLTIKTKLIGNQTQMTTSQIALLRLIPFIHFHLLSLCLIEMTGSFKDYAKSSVISNIPLAVVYTSIGQQLSNLTPLSVLLILTVLFLFVYLFRKKEMTITWREFFQVST
ncbi:MAG TPA: VTT domain-containing protein [Candidatus Avamphibacillus sp.]|nr:VTT domain-containing protein [Candidatus Avamphibacillus sp.]